VAVISDVLVSKPPVLLSKDDIDKLEWQPFPDSPGMWEVTLVRDTESASYTRLIKAEPQLPDTGVRVHEFWEESWILDGSFEENGIVYGPGTFVCNPPGFEHGPYTSSTGWLALEWVHYEPRKTSDTE
jgi:hypothetical protein